MFLTYITRSELTEEENEEFTLLIFDIKQALTKAKPSLDEWENAFLASNVEEITLLSNKFIQLYDTQTKNINERVEASGVANENTPTYTEGDYGDASSYTPPTGADSGGSTPPASADGMWYSLYRIYKWYKLC